MSGQELITSLNVPLQAETSSRLEAMARTVVRDVVAVRAGEEVLIVTNFEGDTFEITTYLYDAAKEAGAHVVITDVTFSIEGYPAILTGSIGEDEKAYGTVHVAIGDNVNGKATAFIHQDCVMLHPSVWVDENALILNGIIL